VGQVGPMWALYLQEGGPSEATHKFVIDPSLQRITINLSLHSELSKKLQTWFVASEERGGRFRAPPSASCCGGVTGLFGRVSAPILPRPLPAGGGKAPPPRRCGSAVALCKRLKQLLKCPVSSDAWPEQSVWPSVAPSGCKKPQPGGREAWRGPEGGRTRPASGEAGARAGNGHWARGAQAAARPRANGMGCAWASLSEANRWLMGNSAS